MGWPSEDVTAALEYVRTHLKVKTFSFFYWLTCCWCSLLRAHNIHYFAIVIDPLRGIDVTKCEHHFIGGRINCISSKIIAHKMLQLPSRSLVTVVSFLQYQTDDGKFEASGHKCDKKKMYNTPFYLPYNHCNFFLLRHCSSGFNYIQTKAFNWNYTEIAKSQTITVMRHNIICTG